MYRNIDEHNLSHNFIFYSVSKRMGFIDMKLPAYYAPFVLQ